MIRRPRFNEAALIELREAIPYSIVYGVQERAIVIAAILHQRRAPKRLTARLR